MIVRKKEGAVFPWSNCAQNSTEWCSRGQIVHRKVLGGGADEVVVMVVMSGTSTKVCSMCVGANVLRVGVVGKF